MGKCAAFSVPVSVSVEGGWAWDEENWGAEVAKPARPGPRLRLL